MPKIQTSPAIAIHPPSELNGQRWIADNIVLRRRFVLPDPAVLALIGAMAPVEGDDLAIRVSSRLCLPLPKVAAVVDALLDSDSLLTTGRESVEIARLVDIREQWQGYGWGEAAEYHLVALDYPFAGRTGAGKAISDERMRRFSTIEPDVNRSKSYAGEYFRVKLPRPTEDLLTAPLTFGNEQSPISFSLDLLSIVVSLNVGVTRRTNVRWDGLSLINRSVPSGGGRHPIEVYFLNVSVKDLPEGCYHCSMIEPELTLISSGLPSREKLENVFPMCFGRAGHRVDGIFVLTAVFDRNMYRYREPRTFRTIFMDAGHMAASIESCCRTLGITTETEYGQDDEEVEALLGLDYLSEGAILSMSVGASGENEGRNQ